MKMQKRMVALCIATVVTIACAAGALTAGFVVSNAARNDAYAKLSGELSFYDNYYAYGVAQGKPLFTATGVNGDVAREISQIVQSITAHKDTTWLESEGGNGLSTVRATAQQYYERTSYDMSTWVMDYFEVPLTERSDGGTGTKSGGVYVKLFDSTGLTYGSVEKSIADQWFQIVYTSSNDEEGEPVITFYMAEPYSLNLFHRTGTTSPGYDLSTLRGIMTTNSGSHYEKLSTAFPMLGDNIVFPSQLPQEWQSNNFQTSANVSVPEGQTNLQNGVGVNSKQNGMNATGLTGTGSYMADALWLPSHHETAYMGQPRDKQLAYSALSNPGSADSAMTNYNRTGLWRLNGYDRSIISPFSQHAYLRSGYLTTASTTTTIVLTNTGAYAENTDVKTHRGIRPALHLDLTDLVNQPDPYEPVDVTDKEELWYYTQTLERVLDGRNTDYTLTNTTTAQELVAEMTTAFETIYENVSDQEYIDGLVASAKLLIQINVTKFKEQIGIITQNVNGSDVEFTTESWTAYQNKLTEIEGLLETIDTKNTQIDTLNTNITELNSQISGLETAKQEAEDEIKDLETQITDLRNSGEDMSTEIAQLEDEITTLTETVTGLESEIVAKTTQVSDLNAQLEAIDLDGLNGTINQLRAEVQALYQAQEELREQADNKGLDPAIIGIIVALSIAAVGMPIIVLFARPRMKRKEK